MVTAAPFIPACTWQDMAARSEGLDRKIYLRCAAIKAFREELEPLISELEHLDQKANQ